MATAKPPTALNAEKGPLRIRRGALLVLIVALAGAAAWFGPAMVARAEAGVAYGARMGCSCRFVAGRELSSCREDFEQGMSLVSLSEDEEAKSVTARVPLVTSDTATFLPGQGCVLEKWGG